MEDITDEVKEKHFGTHPDLYDKYTDPVYIRKRLSVAEGSAKDKDFDVDVAGVYLRRVDGQSERLGLNKK